jgi:peptidoglycan hydrolase CwlO-like protein
MTPDPSIYTVIITLITVLGSTAGWKFFEKRLTVNAQEARDEERQKHLYRDDLRERVAVLESKLDEAHKDRDELMSKIIKMSESLAAMKVEIEFLRKENESLKKQLKAANKEGLS